jgi:peptidoglycan/LPS O-acetylase OafA/YrhL
MHIKLNIDKRDTQIFKGMAIIMITLHNLIHKLPNMPIENEFKFHNYGSDIFFSPLFFENPVSFVFSFFGYYGVQIFIFLSAYAFYLKKDEILDTPYLSFIKKRYLRLLYPLLLSMILVSFLEAVYNTVFFNYSYETILHGFLGIYVGGFLHLTSLYPFIPSGLPGGPGPWWFISFILQAYFIFPVLFKVKFNNTYHFVISFVLSYVFIFITNLYFPEVNIYYTVIGHLPELLLGMYFAGHLKTKSININKMIFIILGSIALIFISNMNENMWYFSFVWATVFFVSLFLVSGTLMTERVKNIFFFIGGISVYVFLLNGVTRDYFIYFINNYSDSTITYWSIIVLYLLVTVFMSYLLLKFERLIVENKNSIFFSYRNKFDRS